MKFLDAVLVGMAPDTAETAAARLDEAMKAAAAEARKKREEWKAERRLRLAGKLKLSDYEINTMLEGALDENTLAGDYQIEV
ncbi:hypothetical protein [Primorskyibacter sp. S187A]|uniref:hypothetical protein n=1 Tax=Primorskyibacter sp. S187A TaxID=3415130 RepID=UPI003C7A7E98